MLQSTMILGTSGAGGAAAAMMMLQRATLHGTHKACGAVDATSHGAECGATRKAHAMVGLALHSTALGKSSRAALVLQSTQAATGIIK